MRECCIIITMKNKNNKYRPVNRWSAEDKQAFADRNFLKSQTVTMRRFEGATEDEWDWAYDEEF